MKGREMNRFALSVFVVAMLAGCGTLSPSVLRPSARVAPDVAGKDLLYVSSARAVTIYSYPQGKLEGTIHTGYHPSGECVDKQGDVWVTNLVSVDVNEYAHGGKKPIATLYNPTVYANGCSIDPTTGDLAVSYLGFLGTGSVAIFHNAMGSPTQYTNSAFKEYFFCAYDNAGNLFIDGIGFAKNFVFGELPKGKGSIAIISLNQHIGAPSGVQWVGKYVAVGDQRQPKIYLFAISGPTGTKVREVSLGSGASDIYQFFIRGKQLIVPNGCPFSCTGQVLFYRWPAGGNATKTITKGIRYPMGAVISEAPKRP